MDPDSFAQKTEQPAGCKRDVSGISHGSVHYSDQMVPIARRLVVTFWRATMIGLRRKNILTYLNPDDHRIKMWQKDHVLQVDNWK